MIFCCMDPIRTGGWPVRAMDTVSRTHTVMGASPGASARERPDSGPGKRS